MLPSVHSVIPGQSVAAGIDHVFASGAVGGRANTHESGRLSLHAQSQETPRVRGGASNHGSWHQNVVNFHSTTSL